MAGEKQAVLRIGAAGTGQFVEALDGVNLAVPERVLGLVVRFSDHDGEIGLAQGRGAKQLVTRSNADTRSWRDVVLDDIEQAIDELNGFHAAPQGEALGGVKSDGE